MPNQKSINIKIPNKNGENGISPDYFSDFIIKCQTEYDANVNYQFTIIMVISSFFGKM